MRAIGTILAGTALLALAACGGTPTAVNNTVSNDVYVVPDDLGNDLLLNESDLNALGPSNASVSNSSTTNSTGNSL